VLDHPATWKKTDCGIVTCGVRDIWSRFGSFPGTEELRGKVRHQKWAIVSYLWREHATESEPGPSRWCSYLAWWIGCHITKCWADLIEECLSGQRHWIDYRELGWGCASCDAQLRFCCKTHRIRLRKAQVLRSPFSGLQHTLSLLVARTAQLLRVGSGQTALKTISKRSGSSASTPRLLSYKRLAIRNSRSNGACI